MIPKFRAINIKTSFWFDEQELVFCDGKWFQNWRSFEDGFPLNMRDCVVMQSTGLKDKNGVEIFEGYVVFHEEGECSYTGIVRKDRYYFYIEGVNINDSFSFDDVSDTYTGEADLVVIGNIYENPELLEAE